jgi:hypothetical protein
MKGRMRVVIPAFLIGAGPTPTGLAFVEDMARGKEHP